MASMQLLTGGARHHYVSLIYCSSRLAGTLGTDITADYLRTTRKALYLSLEHFSPSTDENYIYDTVHGVRLTTAHTGETLWV